MLPTRSILLCVYVISIMTNFLFASLLHYLYNKILSCNYLNIATIIIIIFLGDNLLFCSLLLQFY